MTIDYKLFIKDIVEAISDIEDFIGQIDYEEFLKDKKTRKAIVWQIHIIGKASIVWAITIASGVYKRLKKPRGPILERIRYRNNPTTGGSPMNVLRIVIITGLPLKFFKPTKALSGSPAIVAKIRAPPETLSESITILMASRSKFKIK